jgi:hypothetical protein
MDNDSDIGVPLDDITTEAHRLCQIFTDRFQYCYSSNWASTIAAWWRVCSINLIIHRADVVLQSYKSEFPSLSHAVTFRVNLLEGLSESDLLRFSLTAAQVAITSQYQYISYSHF